MKKTLFTFLTFLFFACSVSAQDNGSKGFYFNAGGGYSFSASNINYVNLCPGFVNASYQYYNQPYILPFTFTGINESFNYTYGTSGENYTNTDQSLNKGFGGGTNWFISAGYSFSKNISAELGFSYLPGTTLQSTYTYQTTDYAGTPYGTIITTQTTASKLTSSPIYRILPAVKFSVPIAKFTPYVKAGLILGMGEKVTLSNAYTEVQTVINNRTQTSGSTEPENVALTASGGLSWGYTGSIGVEYKISNFISVYGEFNIVNETWSPAKGDITAFTVYDGGQTYVLSGSQFTYSNNSTSGGVPGNGNSNVIAVNSEYPKQTFSFNSYGFTVGVKFSILNKSAASNPTK